MHPKINSGSTKVWLGHTSTDFKITDAGGGE
ncbi:hypothetical protein GA0115233_107622 [Streptomyces sp. DI166]|nr:hypothetical protein GA0115233_107622 [Streptomyces sp. DI166]